MHRKNKRLFVRAVCTLAAAAVAAAVFSCRNIAAPAVTTAARGLGKFSAYSFYPQALFREDKTEPEPETDTKAKQVTRPQSTQTHTKKTEPVRRSEKSTQAIAKAAASHAAGRIIEQTILKSGTTDSYGDVYIKNTTGVTIDIQKALKNKARLKIYKNAAPQVLIVHTHATESYFPKDAQSYPRSWKSRTDDTAKNIVAVGAVIAKSLKDAGINTIHDKTLHDGDSYNGAYDSSRASIKKYMKKHPSIDVVLDIHRDAITYDNGDKLKPVIKINSKKAAQIMIISGCEAGGVTGYPDWKYNLRFGVKLQQKTEQRYPGLARPLSFACKKYNQDLCPSSLLIEIGSEANTLKEAKYAASLLSKPLTELLEEYKGK